MKHLYIILVTLLFIGCDGSFLYFPNGQEKYDFDGVLKDDKLNGVLKQFHENGQLKQETKYKNDIVIFEKCWNEKGDEIECEQTW